MREELAYSINRKARIVAGVTSPLWKGELTVCEELCMPSRMWRVCNVALAESDYEFNLSLYGDMAHDNHRKHGYE